MHRRRAVKTENIVFERPCIGWRPAAMAPLASPYKSGTECTLSVVEYCLTRFCRSDDVDHVHRQRLFLCLRRICAAKAINVFSMSRCPEPTWTCLQGGQVHYTHTAAEASYTHGYVVSKKLDLYDYYDIIHQFTTIFGGERPYSILN